MFRSFVGLVVPSFLLLSACGQRTAPEQAKKAGVGTAATADEPTASASLVPAGTGARAPALPELVRASTASTVTGKGAEHFGFKPDVLSKVYALEGHVSTPAWSAAGATPEASRDDDLDTAWTCTANEGQSCALGLALPEVGQIDAVRIYGAAGLAWQQYTGHPRVTQVRVHTDAGFVEAALKDGADHAYVLFDAPIATRTVTVEVIGTEPGKKDQVIHIAELEVYGHEGPARTHLDLDPARVFVRYETTAFGTGEKHGVRQVFLAEARPEGPSARLLRATALYGRKGDRFLLVERLFGTDCVRPTGAYWLLDQHSRVLLPLAGFGTPPAAVIRHPQGLGFATIPFEDPSAWRAVTFENGTLTVRRAAKIRPELPQVGFTDPTELVRGGLPLLGALPPGCTRGSEDADALAAAGLDALLPGFSAEHTAVCTLADGARAVIGLSNVCGEAHAIVVLDAASTVVGKLQGPKRESDRPGRGVWLKPAADLGLVVELGDRGGDHGKLVRVHAGGIEELAAGASFAARSPASCDPCRDGFAPGPELQGDDGEDGGAALEGLDPDEGDEGDADEGDEGEAEPPSKGEDDEGEAEPPGKGEDEAGDEG